MRIAVIGSGVSGCVAARLISTQHLVTLFEATATAGGHAHTVDILHEGRSFPVDTGFMVFNRRTYPNFCRLLELLEVPSQASDMSFSVSCPRTGREYQGSSLNGLFAQRTNCLRPRFLKMLWDIARFNRIGTDAVFSRSQLENQTVGEFLERCRVGRTFVDHYLVPMAAAIWSSSPRAILDFPADFLLGFFANHGLMQLRNRPQWRTVVGGSRTYVHALIAPLRDALRLSTPIESVRRTARGVTVKPQEGPAEEFDEVVLATHADQSLRLLIDATHQERTILKAFPYQSNEAVLHTDLGMLPKRRRAWASWNYRLSQEGGGGATVTYDLSRLQQHNSRSPLLLSLNAGDAICRSRVLRSFRYAHPAYSAQSLAAQARFNEISGKDRIHFCGAYWGYGFHEDGVNSGLKVARYFGIDLEACTAASMKEPLPTAATIP